MTITKEDITYLCYKKIAEIFKLPVEKIKPDDVFGKDILCTPITSEFKENEFDVMLFDIRYVADPKTIKQLNNGGLVIKTVNDYCKHMVHCHHKRPNRVIDTLETKNEDRM